MDTAEARRLLVERLACCRTSSYADLVARIGRVECEEIEESGEKFWQLEFQLFWDSKPNGEARVTALTERLRSET